MSDTFLGLAQGQQMFNQMFYGPQLQQLDMLQKRAQINQAMGLDPVSQSNIQAQQANIDLARQQEARLQEKQQQERQDKETQLLGAVAYAGQQFEDEEMKQAFFRNAAELLGIPDEIVTPENIQSAAAIYQQSIKRQPYQQATGKGMEGFVFDPNSGLFFANPQIAQKIQSLQSKPELKMTDIRDINNDITSLTKQSREARDGASALISIGDKPTPAQAVAAIFKFMKSLDPTSVVRQEEQGLVASASGPMAAFAGYINKLTGGGPITSEVMRDIISTATGIANSTIKETGQSVNSFIEVYPELSEDRRLSMLGRVPKLLEIPEFSQQQAKVDKENKTSSTSRRERRQEQTLYGVTIKKIK